MCVAPRVCSSQFGCASKVSGEIAHLPFLGLDNPCSKQVCMEQIVPKNDVISVPFLGKCISASKERVLLSNNWKPGVHRYGTLERWVSACCSIGRVWNEMFKSTCSIKTAWPFLLDNPHKNALQTNLLGEADHTAYNAPSGLRLLQQLRPFI